MFGLKLPELLIIVVVLLFLFGAKKLPELGKSVGGAIRDFKRAISSEGLLDSTPPAAPAPVAALQRVERPAVALQAETIATAVVVEAPRS